MTATPTCNETIPVALTGRDLWVIRSALELLLASSTRHEHVYHDIRAAMARLPLAHEPRGSGCDCFAATGEAASSGEHGDETDGSWSSV